MPYALREDVCPILRTQENMKEQVSDEDDEDDDSSYHGSPPSIQKPLRKRRFETTLVIHNTGNVWHGMRLDGGRLDWRDPNGTTKGYLPLGYSATRYFGDDGAWVRLTIDKNIITGGPEFVFDLHDGSQYKESVNEAKGIYDFLRNLGLLEAHSNWMTCFELPIRDVEQAPFCAHQRQMEDACLAVGENPRDVLAKHGKLLWLSQPSQLSCDGE